MVNIACSSLIQTILSVLEFHQISRLSGSRTITAGRESQLMLITTTPKNFLLFASDYTTYRHLFQYHLWFFSEFKNCTVNPSRHPLLHSLYPSLISFSFTGSICLRHSNNSFPLITEYYPYVLYSILSNIKFTIFFDNWRNTENML